MKIQYLLLFIILFLTTTCFAQVPSCEWAIGMIGEKNENSYSIVSDDSGNVYITGSTMSQNIDFDPGPDSILLNTNETYSLDVFLGKYDSLGNYIWAFSIGDSSGNGQGSSLALDGFGGLYITGMISRKLDFDPGSGTYIIGEPDTGGAFIAKYSTSGKLIWAKQIKGLGEIIPERIPLAVDESGNIYVSGIFKTFNDIEIDFDPGPGTAFLGEADGRHIFIAKYDSSGQYQWASSIGPLAFADAFDIVLDYQNNLYVTGYFQQQEVDFDPGSSKALFSSSSSGSGFVAKYNSAGEYQYAFLFKGNSQDWATSITTDINNNIYVCGILGSSSVDMDPGEGEALLTTYGSNIINDFFIAKYNEDGKYQWAFSFKGTSTDIPFFSSIDLAGNLIISGSFSSDSVDFDPGIGESYLSPSGYYNMFIAKYNNSGEYLWAFTMQGDGNVNPGFMSIDKHTNIYITGDFKDYPLVFSPEGQETILSPFGTEGYDIFIAKYKDTLSLNWPDNGTVIIYPNPSGGYLNVVTRNISGIKQLSITDMDGKIVMNRENGNTATSFLLDVSYLSIGVYNLRLEDSQGKTHPTKFVIIR